MASQPADDGFDFELVNVCTDDEYEFVEAPVVERHAAPLAAPAQPVAAGGDQAFPPPGRETIRGCDDTKTISVKSPPPHGAVAPTRSTSPPPRNAHAKELKTASPFSSYDAAAARDEEPPVVVWQFNRVQVDDAAPSANDVTAAVATALPPLWYPLAHGTAYGEADQYDEDEDDECDGMYQSCYDFADFGRSRNVKRSSGRRGRTKKKTSMGRPRGEERSSHIAGKW